ncbi:hypothetical protein PBI_GRAVY_80 [Gordonia phage Gravy]|uniref:Uncharacterized protein n=3 Tax=Tanisvirus tanis TaxID=2844677 RepID=A0A5P8D9H4_9CAUD|nr:hypothetical protein HWC73_gp81 [Gordonia phage Tanis]AVO25319.1 hypothetical protein PBI_GRAVY_80 [Gordonia phage Gravy]AVO25412.1 hypothetical protein PBI_KERRY_80 [Gordonia phage Kerry]QFP95655.1 hypothetical protein SEA_TANIS_81 [Gordonia phage Tanis]
MTTANVRQDVLMRPDLLARADQMIYETAMDLQALHEQKMMGD